MRTSIKARQKEKRATKASKKLDLRKITLKLI
jgi:hypothetical protein